MATNYKYSGIDLVITIKEDGLYIIDMKGNTYMKLIP
jgi:hypothetical protein